MKYRYLGHSGLAVSRVCLGTMTFGQEGWGCNEETSSAILKAYAEQGGNFIDTANKYADTLSEGIIGRWLAGQNRDAFVLATKCFFNTSGHINARGLSRKHIMSACEASLRRLGTDYIDLYQAHAPDPQTPIEETMMALDDLVQQGKVRYIGCSNYPAWKVMKSAAICRRERLCPFISGQYLYNLLKRDIEAEIVPACKDSGMGIICWSPLSGGMLTAKYKNMDKPPAGTRLAVRGDLTANRYEEWQDKSKSVVDGILDIAGTSSVSASTVALAWLLGNVQVAAVVAGAKTPEQIRDNCRAGDWELTQEDCETLSRLSEPVYGYPYSWITGNVRDWDDQIL